MQHSDILKVRFKILGLISKIRKEKMYLGDHKYFDLMGKYYDLEKTLTDILTEFDVTQKINATKIEKVKIFTKDYDHIMRTIKLLKIKYNI